MQQAPNNLLSWLDHLRILMPPRHLTLVGAGNGSGPWVQWLLSSAVPSATLVEADDALIAPLQAAVANAPGPWRVRKQVVGPETATVTFHVASVSSESGLLEPESLRGLWPNLKTRQKQTRQAITLDELLQDDEPSANWLIVDCWPALPLLQGGPQALAQTDVAVVRTTLGADTPDTLNPSEVEARLVALGFRPIATDAGRHPGVGHALYVRGQEAIAETLKGVEQWRQAAQRLQNTVSAVQTESAHLTSQVEALMQGKAQAEEELRNAQHALAESTAREQQLTQDLDKARASIETERQSQAENLAAMQQLSVEALNANQALAKLAADYENLKSQIDELKRTSAEREQISDIKTGKIKESLHEAQRQMAEEIQRAQLAKDQYRSHKEALENENQQLKSNTANLESQIEATKEKLLLTEQAMLQLEDSEREARTKAEKLLQEQKGKIDSLEKQVKQLQESEALLRQRQRASAEQFARAEAQLELMKDLLSRMHP